MGTITTGLFRIGNDIEVRYTAKGDAVARLSLASDYGFGDKKATQWIEASLWGKRVESLAPYLGKGSQIYAVLEDVHIETYEGRNGEGHKLVARVLDVGLTAKRDDGERAPQRQAQRPAPRPAPEPTDDDIPF